MMTSKGADLAGAARAAFSPAGQEDQEQVRRDQ